MRKNYWSCSKLADRIRGTPKPKAETSEGWDAWRKAATSAHSVRYWIAEEGLDYLQSFVYWVPDRLYAIKYYINNRWITKTHALTAHSRDIKPGTWQDVGNRFLPCLFNELQDYVEIELAWWHLAWSNKEERAKYNMPWWAVGWWRVRTWRCPQAGLDNLDWQSKLTWTDEEVGSDHSELGKPTPQAIKAREILALYRWWTETYRNRPDPYDASGWTQVCEQIREENDGSLSFSDPKNPALKEAKDNSFKRLQEIEQQYEAEDEEMLIRLIKVRHALWT
jgi:hypothetical protein